MKYNEFLKSKELFDSDSGHEPKDLNPMLFDFQSDIVAWAIRRGRAAIFADCGLGKSPMQLEWAESVHEKTGKSVLIVAPLAVSAQTKREGVKFGISVNICKNQGDSVEGINITNYEKLDHFDADAFGGVVLDESSILKSYTGKTRNKIIEMFYRTPYRLACTATPSPNDFMELGNHSEFLGVLSRSEMLSMFFINDTANVGTWRLKGHGADKFWAWVCSWAVMVKKPSDLGYNDDMFILPPLKIHQETIKYGKPLPGNLFVQNASTLQERRVARKETVAQRCKKAVELVSKSNKQWLFWCGLNVESTTIKKMIPGAVEVTGSDTDDHKEQSVIDFASGKIPVLVTKAKIAGFGVNWQSCPNVVFVGLSDSYEAYYQCIRRCWRFGQKHIVNVYIVTADVEGNVVDNINRKERDAELMGQKMVKNMADFTKKEIKSTKRLVYKHDSKTHKGDGFTLHLGDCVDV
ncbi:MAG TPA: helicase, partial [Deltaproteobacteria bacterium]|nr:helicase [Deltaproteobacteria bacterium]